MGDRFEEVLRTPPNAALDQKFFDTRFRDLHNRLLPLEAIRIEWLEALRVVTDRVLERSEQVISGLRGKLLAITQLEFLTARSGTSRTLVAGTTVSFSIDEADRELFVPGPWAVVSRDGDPADYAVVRPLNFDRTVGQLDVRIETVSGNPGPHDDWTIAAVAGSTLAQLALLAQGKTVRDAAVDAAAAASASAGATAADRLLVAGYRTDTFAARDAAAGSADAASGSKTAAAASAALAQLWATFLGGEVAPGQGKSAKQYALDAAASAASIAGGPVTSVDGQTGIVTLARLTSRGDANYTIVGAPANARDKVVALTAALTAPRVWTLPAANAVPAGYKLIVSDVFNGISAVNTLTLQRAGADTINGAVSYALKHGYSSIELTSDGTSRWTYDVQGVGRGGTGATNEKDARLKLGIEGRATLGDAVATVPASAVVALTAALTAARVWTLPAANSVNPGQGILISDEVGGISAVNTLTLAPAGTDTINGAATLVLKTARSLAYVVSNGTDRWSFDLGAASADAVAANTSAIAANTTAIAARPTLAVAAALSAYGGNSIGY